MRAVLIVCGALSAASAWAGDKLEEVIVTATLRSESLVKTPGSVTVLDSATLQDAGRQHFQDVLSLAPNLNWAGGTSRPRYFQIRGVGEREQYEGAPNPSVGFIIDDIDFSGLGMPATLFDVDSIEVLRGPQGTRYGANALAGLIVVRGNDPQDTPHFNIEAMLGNYDTRAAGFAATAPVESLNSSWRLSVQQHRSDGFRNNVYLHRPTNELDELTGRFKWRWRPGDATTVDFTLLHANLDNGYDAWSIDNSRNSLSDRPGQDAQRATGASARVLSTAWNPYTITMIASYVDSKSISSFDADWGNASSWAPYLYDYFQRADRDRRSASLEWRLASPAADATQPLAWLVGAYALRMREEGRDILVGEYADPSDPTFDGTSNDNLASAYRATNIAVFGQLDGYLSEAWRWAAGVRLEQRNARYRDSGVWSGLDQVTDLDARDRMLGGHVSLSFDVTADATLYAALSRGYKAGGFNLGGVQPQDRYFDPEYLWNLETGVKASLFDGRAFMDTTLFYEWRRDLQERTGTQLDPMNPGTYVFITDNIARGYNTGIESSVRYLVSPAMEVGGSLGLLRTRESGALDDAGAPAPAREQTHAPEYTAAIYGVWRHASGLMARADVSAKDNFYFDVPSDHNMRSHAYSITNIKLGYERPAWSVHLWAQNVFDEEYDVRGFYFYNEPPFAEKHLYLQHGEPRTFGVSGSWNF